MSADRPNILIVLTDQLRRDALACYGDPNVSTPNIDRLAAGGARFANACSTYPICQPFRFTLMTGEYAHSRNVFSVGWRMSPAERTLADEFNEAGYHTVYVGKWHLYGGWAAPGAVAGGPRYHRVPRSHQGRWQKWLGFEVCNNHFHTYYYEDDDPAPRPVAGYHTDGLFDLAMGYLREAGAREAAGRPFCCVLSVEPPHFPYEAPEELAARWRGREIALPPNYMAADEYAVPLQRGVAEEHDLTPERRRIYYAMIENLDANVGRLMEYLEAEGLAGNTVVIFLSDHGEMGGAHRIDAYLKQYPYEESVGIPLIVAGAGCGPRAGTVIDEPVAAEDLFPTLLGLAGLPPCGDLPGADLAPLIRGDGGAAALGREGVMLEFVHDPRGKSPFHELAWRGWRGRRWKYTVLGPRADAARPWQLFDLAEDPYEMHNRIDDPACRRQAERCHRLLRERMAETGDHFILAPAFGCPGLNVWPEA
jgi:arylsulfatase A-like enzyme